MGAILYVLSPLITDMLYKSQIVGLNPMWGLMTIYVVSLMSAVFYVLFFSKQQFKP